MENSSALPATSDPLRTTAAGPVLETDAGSRVEAAFICILIVATLAANIFVGVTILRKSFHPKRLSNLFIVNLCVADVLFAAISMPVWVIFKLYATTASSILSDTFVELWSRIDILCGTAAILSLASISLDRYLAITRPMTYIRSMTSLRAKLLIGTIWLYSTVVAFMRKPLYDLAEGKSWPCMRRYLPTWRRCVWRQVNSQRIVNVIGSYPKASILVKIIVHLASDQTRYKFPPLPRAILDECSGSDNPAWERWCHFR